jgi:hypothetical protein
MAEPSQIDPQAVWAKFKAVNAEFCEAFGTFIMRWTNTETRLYGVLLRYSGVEDGVGRAIFSGTRAPTIMDYIRGIAANTERISAVRLTELEFAFAQMATIRTTRDYLVHYAEPRAIMGEDGVMRHAFTNSSRVSRLAKTWHKDIIVNDVQAMISDLEMLAAIFIGHLIPDDMPFSPLKLPSGEPPTWLYKPEQPQTQNQQNGNPQSRKTRQKPSQP